MFDGNISLPPSSQRPEIQHAVHCNDADIACILRH